MKYNRGVPPPWDHDAFSPLFQISPPIFEKFSDSKKNLKNFTFSWKISWFSSVKISDDLFFSHRPQIPNFPYFRYFSTFPSLFRENYYFPPTLTNFLPCFTQIHRLFTYFTCISFPLLLLPWCIYASPNARTGRPWNTKYIQESLRVNQSINQWKFV